MAEIGGLLGRQDLPELTFHLHRVLGAVRHPQAACDADAVGIADIGGLLVHVAQNQIRRLSAHPGRLVSSSMVPGTLPPKSDSSFLRRPPYPATCRYRSRRSECTVPPPPGPPPQSSPGWGSAGTGPGSLDSPGRQYTGRKGVQQTAVHSLFVLQRAEGVRIEDLQLVDDAFDSGFGFHILTSY